ncbi:perlucin-like [Mercenaria mercenaria]|uniref:perlucin-like n=1 Tax=Mercenaria mercenaria TaxID=6596 RepID=UPI001E1D8C4A|nr:perlucin-like [Mercenaria mercenaria]
MLLAFLPVLLFVKGCMSATACMDGFEPHQGSCYFFSHDKETWTGAYQSCKLFDAMLVEVNSADEDAYLSSKTSTLGNYWWIGLTDKLVEGQYVWETSLQVMTKDSFSNWGTGEPDGAGDEDCVVYAPSRNYQWGDAICTRTEHYICEKSEENGEIVG